MKAMTMMAIYFFNSMKSKTTMAFSKKFYEINDPFNHVNGLGPLSDLAGYNDEVWWLYLPPIQIVS